MKITTSLFGDLALLPFMPNSPIKETLEWLTDLTILYDGTEQRLQNRSMPRQSFQYAIPLQYWKKAEAFNTLYGAIRNNWAIPIWTEGQIIETITSGQPTITCDTSVYDLRADSLALIFRECDGDYEVIEIQSITTTSITAYSNIANDWANVWLFPMRKGFIVGNVQETTNIYEGLIEKTFQIDDNLSLTVSDPTQFLLDDIYSEASLFDESDKLDRSFQMRQDLIDYLLGPVERRTPWQNSRLASFYNILLNTASDIRSFKEFLYRRAGKFRQFWYPTFENNIRLLSTSLITSTIIAESFSTIDYASACNHIAIEDIDGNWYFRTITDYTQLDPDQIQLTLDTDLNVYATDIVRISYLLLHRLDTDRIELNWIGNNVVESSISTIGIEP